MNLSKSISTVFGIGYLPIMPGSWCSLIVALPALIVTDHNLPQYIFLALSCVFFVAGWWSVGDVQAEWGSDPKRVVVDEAAGMALILATPYPYFGIGWWASSLLLFRIFDVVKPWPINLINDRTEPWSVMTDDILAAVFTMLSLMILFPVFQIAVISLQAF